MPLQPVDDFLTLGVRHPQVSTRAGDRELAFGRGAFGYGAPAGLRDSIVPRYTHRDLLDGEPTALPGQTVKAVALPGRALSLQPIPRVALEPPVTVALRRLPRR